MYRTVLILMICLSVASLIGARLSKSARALETTNANPITTAPELQTPGTLCNRDEQIAFQCTMQKSAKVLSICTSKQLNSQNGYIQYRFGLPGKIELEFPAERVGSQKTFSYSRYTRPLVTYLAFRFESNGYKYSVHQDSNAEEKPSVNSSYVRITSPEANSKETELSCREPVKGSLMLLEDVVPASEGPDVLAP